MRSTTTRPARISWVVMGPPPHLAHCTRCGKTIPPTPLPIDATRFLVYVNRAVLAHRNCVVPPSDAAEHQAAVQ